MDSGEDVSQAVEADYSNMIGALISSFTFAPPPCLALISPERPVPFMEMKLYPAVSLLSETNSRLGLHRHKILFFCGKHSRILSRLYRNVTEPAKVRGKQEARMREAHS